MALKFKKQWSRVARAIGCAALLATLAACGGSSDPEQPADSSTTSVDTARVVSVDSPSSPIYGTKAEIPAESLVDSSEAFTITYEDNLPAPLNAESQALGATQISKVLVLGRISTVDFGKSVAVTVPYDKAALPADAVPIVVYWDESLKAYSPVTIQSIDRDKGTVTFMTAHFSKFVVIVLNKLFGTAAPSATALTTDVGFRPAVDGFFVHNFGSYDSPGGNCFGMAGFSAWYHASKKASKGAGLATLYKEGDQTEEEDDQTVRELITRVYQAGDQKGHIAALNWVQSQNFLTQLAADRFTAYSIIQQLIVTKQAQIMAMGVGKFFGWTKGHAVTVYAYDGATKAFKFYDNNFPGEVIDLPWDPATGFGTYTVKNVTWDLFAFASFNQAYSPATLEAFFNGAETGWNTSHFPKISIQSPTELTTPKNVFEVASADNVEIKGSVPRAADAVNPTAQRYAHLYLQGVRFGAAVPVSSTDNSFTIPISTLPVAAGTDVMILISESSKSWAGGFHAFKQFKLRVAGQYFFKNMGFETGNFDFWVSERHLWNGTGSVTPSDKSSVVTSIYDPHANDLKTTLFGSHAARINNEDNDYHISSLTQSAVVPTSANPVVRFYWAAVLQDPDHPPEDQPYVDVTVTDQTTGTVLYTKHFYSNDPTYSGWKSYEDGAWKSIPWQFVEVPVAQYVGHTIAIKVMAADCNQGGHGGYAYLDAEE